MRGHIVQDASGFVVSFPLGERRKRIQRRKATKEEAERYLNYLRHMYDEGIFRPSEHVSPSALAFDRLAKEWLAWKAQNVKNPKTWKVYSSFMARAIQAWGDRNVKTIGYAEIQAFLDSLSTMGGKSRANVNTCFKAFWTWMQKNGKILAIDRPEFPTIKYKLGRRKTVDKTTQAEIIGEVHRITNPHAIKVWLGVKWLATYPALRPGDLPRVRECDIDVGRGLLNVRDSKNSDPFEMPMTVEDVRLLKEINPGRTEITFFRHAPSKSYPSGRPYDEKLWYKYWVQACKNLGIEGVDLYGGTRHSTVRAMRHAYSPEQIRWATKHRTNKAFERYFELDDEDLREMYEEAGQGLGTTPVGPEPLNLDKGRSRVGPTGGGQVVVLKRK